MKNYMDIRLKFLANKITTSVTALGCTVITIRCIVADGSTIEHIILKVEKDG
jgi:hypothetical protein